MCQDSPIKGDAFGSSWPPPLLLASATMETVPGCGLMGLLLQLGSGRDQSGARRRGVLSMEKLSVDIQCKVILESRGPSKSRHQNPEGEEKGPKTIRPGVGQR